MKPLLASLLFAATCCHAQVVVPKPPWASGGSGTSKPAQPPAAKAPEQPAPEPSTTIRVNVKLVNVFVTVTDDHGAPVGGLTKDNFQLSEDGAPQKIAVFDKESALPLSIALDVDTSLSTRRDLPLELASARRFVHAILRPVDALSLYQFSEVVDQVTPFTSDLQRIDRAIDRVHLGSATALYDALYLSSQALERRQGRKVLVVITDGGDTISQVNYQDALREAQEAEALVYSIIIVPIEASAGRDTGGEHALIQLSEDTGGRYFYATSAPQLDNAFRQISDELRTQYLLAYYPLQRFSGSDYRRIDVKVQGPPDADTLKVRHRTGYYTTKSDF
ncbi:MAG TPA: VWA domain-containing protein [Terriglobales bacterium]|nr:VWA domain-containing protein [Terriglobales bacterium]